EKYYWQHDHVRLYGRDYGKRLIQAGFEVTEDTFIQEIGEELTHRYALIQGENILVCRKPNATH
ncbi:MAG TPA: SAM-dependent methyltransferase, partial [Marinilabiliales bacterium]|nr:SAM-dependent methyltransferase [Marinilabiliales bacterium]